MIKFRETLRQRLNDILVPAVGPGSDPTDFIRYFDKRLRDVGPDQLPELVINVRTSEKMLPGEIGNPFQKYTWTVHIYYIDMETVVANYNLADERRNHIMARVEKTLESNRFLQLNNQPLQTMDADGHREAIYDSSIQTIIFDESGEDGGSGTQAYSTFTTELHFEVYTDRS